MSLAVLGLLLFLLAALAPVYPGVSPDQSPTIVLLGFGAILLGLSIFGAVLLALLELKNSRG
jgi:hypothetical protein